MKPRAHQRISSLTKIFLWLSIRLPPEDDWRIVFVVPEYSFSIFSAKLGKKFGILEYSTYFCIKSSYGDKEYRGYTTEPKSQSATETMD
jgi:hypothetical protein